MKYVVVAGISLTCALGFSSHANAETAQLILNTMAKDTAALAAQHGVTPEAVQSAATSAGQHIGAVGTALERQMNPINRYQALINTPEFKVSVTPVDGSEAKEVSISGDVHKRFQAFTYLSANLDLLLNQCSFQNNEQTSAYFAEIVRRMLNQFDAAIYVPFSSENKLQEKIKMDAVEFERILAVMAEYLDAKKETYGVENKSDKEYWTLVKQVYKDFTGNDFDKKAAQDRLANAEKSVTEGLAEIKNLKSNVADAKRTLSKDVPACVFAPDQTPSPTKPPQVAVTPTPSPTPTPTPTPTPGPTATPGPTTNPNGGSTGESVYPDFSRALEEIAARAQAETDKLQNYFAELQRAKEEADRARRDFEALAANDDNNAEQIAALARGLGQSQPVANNQQQPPFPFFPQANFQPPQTQQPTNQDDHGGAADQPQSVQNPYMMGNVPASSGPQIIMPDQKAAQAAFSDLSSRRAPQPVPNWGTMAAQDISKELQAMRAAQGQYQQNGLANNIGNRFMNFGGMGGQMAPTMPMNPGAPAPVYGPQQMPGGFNANPGRGPLPRSLQGLI